MYVPWVNQSRTAEPARKHLVWIVMLWQNHEAIEQHALGELRWHSGRQQAPPGHCNGHAPQIDNGELDDAPQTSDRLSAWSERPPVATEAFDITFDIKAATIMPLDGRPWRADVISAWHPVSVAMPTNMSPPISLFETNTRRTPKIGMG